MERLTTTPFGPRPISAGLLATVELAKQAMDCPPADKWTILQDLTAAKARFGVTDRDLSVLSALLSFHPDRELSGAALIVFPSNASLAERAHGMAESTLRRYLGALVRAGLLLRHDSPNGKRYATRDGQGAILRAFGFDLSPLLARAAEISEAAAEAREAAHRLKMAREKAVIRMRDLRKLLSYLVEEGAGAGLEAEEAALGQAARAFRRKLDHAEIEGLLQTLKAVEQILIHRLNACKTEETSGNDSDNERHNQNSKTNTSDKEPDLEKVRAKELALEGRPSELPFALVLKACREIQSYAPDEIRNWRDFHALADLVRPMLGVSLDAWSEAQTTMGPEAASVALAYILERLSEIRSPGGYLRALSERAGRGAFSPGPLVMALLSPRKPSRVDS